MESTRRRDLEIRNKVRWNAREMPATRVQRNF